MGPSKKARKNKQKKARLNGENENGLQLDANGFIPNGTTIDFDEFDLADMSTNEPDDNAPRGGYGSQVLPVDVNLPEDYAGDPTDGHEYLFLVRREAAAHPGIKTAEDFLLRQRQELAKLEATLPPVAPVAGPSHRPSIEWRTAFLSRFVNMREVFANADTPPSTSHAIPQAYASIPSAADESSWKTYINGRKKVVKASKDAAIPSAKGKEKEVPTEEGEGGESEAVDMDVSDPEVEESLQPCAGDLSISDVRDEQDRAPSSSTGLTMQDPKPPIPAVMKSLDHHTTISLLEHFNTWLLERIEAYETITTPSTVFLPPSMRKNKKKPAPTSVAPAVVVPEKALPAPLMSALDSQWIFALFTVLDQLLSGAEISILRTLARTCLDIADTTHTLVEKHITKAGKELLEKWTECIASCWMVVSVVWEVWGQRDMWEA